MSPSDPDTTRRHPHLASTLPTGHVRVDLHTHTMWSGDSTTTPDELEAAVVASGVDVVAVTDHNAVEGAQRLVASLPCRVIVGEEVRTRAGELIGLFLTDRVVPGLDPEETARRIREQGGLVYVPHPFDPMRAKLSEPALARLVDAGLVDVIEGRNAKTSLEHLNTRAADFARTHDVAVGAGSDAHVPDALGAAVVEMPDFDGPASFLAAIGSGRLAGHHFDEPRPWTARIVPSTST